MIIRGYQTIAKKGPESRFSLLNDFLLASNYAGLAFGTAGCAAGAVSSNDKYVGMEPVAAAEAAAAETKDTTSISDLIRVPFGYLLDWLYTFTNSYGLALILMFIGVKMLLLDIFKIPTGIALGVVALILLASMGLSLLMTRKKAA